MKNANQIPRKFFHTVRSRSINRYHIGKIAPEEILSWGLYHPLPRSERMKEKLRSFALSLGVDDGGFASVHDYRSSLSPRLATLFPGVQSITVLACRELSSCESPQAAMNGRLDIMAFIRAACDGLGRFVETQLGRPAMTIAFS